MNAFSRDVQFVVRSLLRAPGFAVTAALTLALGIGLSTTVFTVADALLLRRLPVGEQERIVTLWGETRGGQFSDVPLPLADVREFQSRSRTLDAVAFFGFRGATPTSIRSGEQAFPVRVALVSGNYFAVLRSGAALGRALRPEDDVEGAAPVLVLSQRAWRQQFGGDSSIVGRTLASLTSGRSYTIVGVMPRGLDYPRGTDVWAPVIAYSAANGFLGSATGELNMLARLRPSATAEQARAELTAFLGRVEAPAAWRHARGVVHSLPDLALGDTKPALLLVALAAALLLLITCVNVANLMLVRAVGRVREFAVRSALGAGRARLLGQVVTESALLSLVGGVIGVGLSVAGVRAFVAIAPDSLPRLDEIGVDSTAVGAAVVVTALTMLVAGLGPAWFTSRVNAHDLIRSGARTTGGRRVRRVTELLVIGQVALAAAVLSAAGLVSRSLVKLQHVDLSFEPKGLLVANLTMRQDQIGGRERQQAALDLVVARATALPGVLAVTPVITVPLVGAGGGIDGRPTKPGQTREEIAEDPIVNMEAIAPNHFATLGTRVLRGRAFGEQDRDGSSPVAIVSSAVARHFWPGGDPIGQRLNGPGHEVTVVGVVPDTRYRQLQDARPTLYVPLAQSPFPMIPSALLIRTATLPARLVPSLRQAVADARVGATVVSATPLEQLLAAPRAEPRLNAMVLTLFALSAMFLAAIGLFAVIATLVRHRTQELGIRMALGATAGALGRLVIARGLALATAGAAIGLVGALAGSRLLSSLLFEVSPTDAATQLAVVALMACVGVIASLAPMRRCMRIDPAGALRSEG